MAFAVANVCFLAFFGVLVILYGLFTEYATPAEVSRYAFFQDVHVMIFIGFGFLMTFLHKSGFTAVSHSYLVAVLTVLWAMLVRGFFTIAFSEHAKWETLKLNLEHLVTADFAAGAVLISFGAVLGRFSATQLLVMSILEVVVYSVNEAILVERLKIADIGGSMVIHAFGAYFGLSVSWAWAVRDTKQQTKDRSNNRSNKQTDTMAMVGTLFLFCFWPSFNGVLAGTNSQDRAILNTYLSICSSCFVSFLVCSLTDDKSRFRMVEIQNSTIAGGVAIGTAADMLTTPCGAMLIGGVSGGLSVLGYYYVTPVLRSKLGVEDTCGIHNLHGIPGIIGAIVGMIVSAVEQDGEYKNDTLAEVFAGRFDEEGHLVRSASEQGSFQCAALFVTLGMAIAGGLATGVVMRILPDLDGFYHDAQEYEVPETPAKVAEQEVGEA
eukprot:CAMPEP_0194491752 /NCGR_PEP_ID=MMETSP0253-20130528/10526_1 /TAXON_ID=2966 /ORGANISM="Noctiluca scintillans" /LENGTH=435 /DNA_ID=CAMNT_0039332525 /DNA_START=255 /DNA_END=1562 /DNA_ORIENTATION=+